MITYIIIFITILVSIIAMDNLSLKNKLMFNAYQIHHRKEWYRFFSNGLIHADWMHLAFNMYSLYIFGLAAEERYHIEFDDRAIDRKSVV